jgi:hypothetical protein
MSRSTIRANAIAVVQSALSQSWREGDGLFKTQAETGGDECTRKSPLHPNLHFYHQSSALDWPLTTIRVRGQIHCLAASPGSPLGPGGPIGPGGPGGPTGPGGPATPQRSISTTLLSSPEVISTMHVEGYSNPIHLNPPVGVLSTWTVLPGLILICTLGSRGRLTLPTITNSPRVIAAVVTNISAHAFPPHVATVTVATARTARTSFASMEISNALCQNAESDH